MTIHNQTPACRTHAVSLPLTLSTVLVACLAAQPASAVDPPKKPLPPPPVAKPPAPAVAPAGLVSPFNLKLNTPPVQQPPAVNNAQRPLPNAARPGVQRPVPPPVQKFIPGPPVVSRNFPGHPAPPGSLESQARNGSIVRKAADGQVLDVRNVRTGVSVHHALDGTKQVVVERPDHSRVFIPARGIRYVQRPYVFQGRPLVNRTLVVQGQLFNQIYRPFNYGNTTLDVYATSRYYAANYYQWTSTPFKTQQNFAWGYVNNNAAWYGHYRGYFTPEPSYPAPAFWLTDYIVAATLYVAYNVKDESGEPAPEGAAPITPEVKQALAKEVQKQVSSESLEAQQVANHAEPTAAAGSVVQTLSDRDKHTFLVSSGLDLVDSTGRRCSLSEGDVVSTVTPIDNTGTVGAIVLSSKGGAECGAASQVQLAVNDVQEMQNHMRETIDQGLASTKAAEQAQSMSPAFATAAPPADANAANEIRQQEAIAAAAES